MSSEVFFRIRHLTERDKFWGIVKDDPLTFDWVQSWDAYYYPAMDQLSTQLPLNGTWEKVR